MRTSSERAAVLRRLAGCCEGQSGYGLALHNLKLAAQQAFLYIE